MLSLFLLCVARRPKNSQLARHHTQKMAVMPLAGGEPLFILGIREFSATIDSIVRFGMSWTPVPWR
ncbi:hypothetical protein [Microbulbifer pacificus]|uniref:hypothetical protein n=1 Tax=Microbulbifer pacificus TaxID=407164 RepID=UPI001319BE8E|nr:hypothetical protein [Microbulbifer pacificus]